MIWLCVYMKGVMVFWAANLRCFESSQCFQYCESRFTNCWLGGSIPKPWGNLKRSHRCKRGFELTDSKLVIEEQAPGKAPATVREEQVLSERSSNRLVCGSKRKRTSVLNHRQMATICEKQKPVSAVETVVLTSSLELSAEPSHTELNATPPRLPRPCEWDHALTPKLEDRSVIFHRILQEELLTFQENNKHSIDTGLSPVVSYFSIRLSRVLEKEMSHEAKKYMKKFSRDSSASLGFSHEFLLPFCYQLLLIKPSYNDWRNIKDLFIQFHIRWSFMMILQEDFECEQTVSFRGAIVEKSAKMFQWISELLKNAYVPEFIQNVTISRKKLFENKANRSGRLKGVKEPRLLSRIYEWLGGVQTRSSHNKANRNTKTLANLVSAWQHNYRHGYPRRMEKDVGNSVVRECLEGLLTHESCQKVWKNWGLTILNIQRSADVFNLIVKRKIPEGIIRNFFLSKRDFEVWEKLSCPCSNEETSSQRRKQDLWLKEFKVKISEETEKMLEEIPQVLWEQLGPTDTLEKLRYFSKRRNKWFKEQYLPDEIETFFHLDEILGDRTPDFMDEFMRNQNRVLSKHLYYRRTCGELNKEIK